MLKLKLVPKILFLFFVLLVIAGCKDEHKEAPKVTQPTLPKTMAIKPKPAVVKPKMKPVARKTTKDVKELEAALKAGVPVVVKLGSDSCYPCRQMNPVIKELAEEQDSRAIFLNLDVYQHKELARQAQVKVIPTILFYDRHGKPRGKSEGGMSKEQLLQAIEEMELNK